MVLWFCVDHYKQAFDPLNWVLDDLSLKNTQDLRYGLMCQNCTLTYGKFFIQSLWSDYETFKITGLDIAMYSILFLGF